MKKIDATISAPQGFCAAGVKANIKKSGKHDVGLLYCETPASVAGVFTQNKIAAAPVHISRAAAGRDYARALIVNSGCANACTGDQGMLDARAMVQMTANALDISTNEVLVCSTGVIGQLLPMGKVADGIRDVAKEIGKQDGSEFALAIMTTDTFMKKAAYEIEIDGHKVLLSGVAKGAGMIHPNMATMLCFITTDVNICPKVLKKMVSEIANKSFNMIVVDGDTSTNDTMLVMASNLAGNCQIDSEQHPDYNNFYQALLAISQDLAKLIVRDGEGATKFLEINVKGAKDFAQAKMAAMSIAKSPLVKTAFFGKDANWGRIICAAGYSGADLDPKNVTLHIEDLCIMKNGLDTEYNVQRLTAIMQNTDIKITLDLAVGNEEATVWTCDFSYDYVKINAEYHM